MGDRNPKVYWIITTLIVSLLQGCGLNDVNLDGYYAHEIHCDMDRGNAATGLYFTDNGVFTGWDQRYSAASHSGQYCMRLVPEDETGFGHTYYPTEEGEVVKVRFFNLGSPGIVVVFNGMELIERYEFGIAKQWTEHEFTVEPKPNERLRVIALCAGEQHAFIDDFTITRYLPNSVEKAELPTVKLTIDKKQWANLQTKRDKALEKGNLIKEKGDNQKALLTLSDQTFNAKVRLKGDWVDHLEGEKWSFRVAYSDSARKPRGQKFSLHHPYTRDYAREWLLHEFARSKDILATDYDFVRLQINGADKGIYAKEGHFDRHLLNRYNRPSGVIIKFDESGFWQSIKERKGSYLNAAPIVPFDQKKVLKSEQKLKWFLRARDLLRGYQRGTLSPDAVFDVHKLAQYYALCITLNGTHAMIWHNIRYYYNPKTDRLEPILYDACTGEDSYVDMLQVFTKDDPISSWPESSLLLRAFSSETFTERFIAALDSATALPNMSDLSMLYQAEMDSLSYLLKSEFPFYHFDFNHFHPWWQVAKERLGQIRAHKDATSQFHVGIDHAISVPCKGRRFGSDKGVLAYMEQDHAGNPMIRIDNVFCDALEVHGSVGKDTMMVYPKYLAPALCGNVTTTSMMAKSDAKQVLVKRAGHDEIVAFEVLPWRGPALD